VVTVVAPDPFRIFRFVVELDATVAGGFQSVAGIQRQTQIEPYHEGGVNEFERQFVVRTTYPPLVLKRGLTDTRLWDWHQQVIAGDIRRRTISVLLIEAGREVWRWIVAGAYPSKGTGADLDAMGDSVATESVELVHCGITRQ